MVVEIVTLIFQIQSMSKPKQEKDQIITNLVENVTLINFDPKKESSKFKLFFEVSWIDRAAFII